MQPPGAPSSSRRDETLRVRAPISDPPPKGEGPQFETMHALSDPAAEDQAVLVNAPAFCDYLNYGDLVRVGPPRDNVRPILAVVAASGHTRVGTFTGRHDPSALVERLRERFPEHALRLEGSITEPPGPHMLTVSVHPDFDPEDVRDEIADWLDEQGATPDDASISPPIETQLGPVQWPPEEDE
jgi:Domain of unknown function (DUF4265)